ncbi:MAG TPA: glycosyl hydrolase family 65 protein, partial [Chthonomonadales bacterium]|nr:glycosyl hydrolase family 65 protein [Chthonomonadales bacterium]
SLAQSWAVISGKANQERADQAMHSVEDHLVCEAAQLVLLFTPPFDRSQHDPGYIKGYLPGVRENGGQYTHGSLWVPMAYARLGDGASAVKLLRMMNSVEHSRTPDDVERFKVEPYVSVGDVYSLAGKVGRGGWTWYSGSAGWMYRIWLEEVLGFQLRGERLTISPVLPPDWPGFAIRFRYRKSSYVIRVEQASDGSPLARLDGAALPSPSIRLVDDGAEHDFFIRLAPHSRPTAQPES